MINGTLHTRTKALHDIYGPVVRVAPNELSFIAPEAWKDIYSDKPYGLERSETYYGIAENSVLFGVTHKDNVRIRGAVSTALRASGRRGYEENIGRYVHLLLEQLDLMVMNKACDGRTDKTGQEEVTVDIVRWLNFTAFDIAGNLIYGGEPFGCLRRREYHPWVELIFTWFETVTKLSSIRYYTPLDRVLMWLVPFSLINFKQKEEFERLGRDCVRERMLSADDEIDEEGAEDSNKGYGRALPTDILSRFKLSNCGPMMTMAEMEADLHLLAIAGSETVATAISGTMNYLCQNPAALKTLADEVRSAVSAEADLNIANVSRLPYLTAVLKEGLRIGAPAPFSFPRVVPLKGASIHGYWVPGRVSLIHPFVILFTAQPRVNKGAQIEVNPSSLRFSPPHWIKKAIAKDLLTPISPQTIVGVNSFAATRSATHFYQPLAFLPERWLDPAVASPSSPFASDKRDASKHFGAGSRDCLGQVIAWTEMRLVLAGLIWAFDIEAVRKVDWAQQKTYIIWQKKPFEVRIRRRVQV